MGSCILARLPPAGDRRLSGVSGRTDRGYSFGTFTSAAATTVADVEQDSNLPLTWTLAPALTEAIPITGGS
jgi:hypothetical protein